MSVPTEQQWFKPRLVIPLFVLLAVMMALFQAIYHRRHARGAGTGLISLSPTSLAFGNVAVGTIKTQTIALTNTGTAGVTISQATVSGAGFSISGLPLPLAMPAGKSGHFSVTFAPSVAGSATGNVSLVSNAAGSPASITLSGTGTAAVTGLVSTSPGGLAFGNVVLGSDAILPVVMTNTGSTSVTITQATVTGAGFSVGGLSLPYTLAAGQNASLSVTFAPTASGSSAGTVTIVSNGSTSTASVGVSGTGIHSVSLAWTASTSSGVTGYNVFRATTSGGPYAQINGSLVAATSYTDSAVQAGTTYYYVTTAVNGSGTQSGYSNEASVTVPSQ